MKTSTIAVLGIDLGKNSCSLVGWTRTGGSSSVGGCGAKG